MRILVINNIYPPQELGGYGRSIHDFAAVLAHRGHETRVLCANLPEWQRGAAEEPHVRRVLQLFGRWKDGGVKFDEDAERIRLVIEYNHRAIADTINRFRPDACLTGNIDLISPLPFESIVAKSVPVLHHLGNSSPSYPPPMTPVNPLYRLSTASHWLKDYLMQKGYPIKSASVIYPGAHVQQFKTDTLPPREQLRIAFAGLVMPYKGADLLMQALGLLYADGIPFSCAIAGDTVDPGYVQNLKDRVAQEGFAAQLSFLGYQSREQLIALYRTHNVLAFPTTINETFGISQVEAMAAGLVCVSSGNGGAAEVVEHGVSGLIFESGNAAALAQALSSLPKNPSRWEQLARAGQRRAIEQFDIERSVDRLEREFERLAKLAGRK
jgi:glycosyltransferase involved in cell wall biosynthesis